jgi:hypothetical protein
MEGELGPATADSVAQGRGHGGLLPVEPMDQGRRSADRRPGPAQVRGQAERGLVEEDQAGSAPLGVCRIRGQRSLTQRSIAAWSRSAARRLGRWTLQPKPIAQQRPHPARMMVDSGEALDHRGGPVQGPQLPDEPVRGRAVQQGLLDLGELGIRQPGRRAARAAAVQALGAALLPAGMPNTDRLGRDLELAGDLGLVDAGGEQLGGAQPASLQAVTSSLCRRAARDSWHGADPHPPASRTPTPSNPQPDTQIPFK